VVALCELHIYSEALGLQTTVNVIIPQKSTNGEIGTAQGACTERYKCLFLLHGLSDDQSIWLRRTSIERYAQAHSLCVVMPFGGRSFYTDMRYGEKYYTYIAEELPRLIASIFPVSDKREDHFIAGVSMGGYGALKIGLKNSSYFSAAAGLSSVADVVGCISMFRDVFIPVFGESTAVPASENLFTLSETHKNDTQKPRLFLGVGTEDFLYEGNCKLKEHLQNLDYDFTYRESAGIHSWNFWDEYIQYVLEWLLK